MIAHRLSSVTDADCICVMQDGRIAEKGFLDGTSAKRRPVRPYVETLFPGCGMENQKGGTGMIHMLQKRFALSRQGARDLIRGCIACVLQDISFMFPVGLLYFFCHRPDGGRNQKHSCLPLCAWRLRLPDFHLCRHPFSVQRHLSGHLCGKRRPENFPGGTASQDPPFLLREKRILPI